MKNYKAVEHKDHFEIHYAGDKKPFKVAKGVLTPDRLEKIRKNATQIKMADGGMMREKEEPSGLQEDYANEKPDILMLSEGRFRVERSSDRKGKTHKVTNTSTGEVRYFGDSNLGQHPKDPARKKAFYARHKKNLDRNPFFRAFARKTWAAGGLVQNFEEGTDGVIDAMPVAKPKSYEEYVRESSGLQADEELPPDILNDPELGRQYESYVRETAAENDPLAMERVAFEAAKKQRAATLGEEIQTAYQEAQPMEGAAKVTPDPALVAEAKKERLAKEAEKAPIDAKPDLQAIELARRETRKAEARAAGEARRRKEYVLSDLEDTSLSPEERADLADKAANDPTFYTEVVSRAFKDALNQGATLDEAKQIVRQMRRGGEDIGLPQFEGDEEEATGVDLEGLETPSEGKDITAKLGEERVSPEGGVKGETKPSAVAPHEPPVPNPPAPTTSATGLPTIPAKPREGEVAVPEGELTQMPEYGVAYQSMLKALGPTGAEEAKAFAKEYALKSRQAQVLDTTRSGVPPEQVYSDYVEDQARELQFQSDLKQRANDAAAKLAAQDAQIAQRKAESVNMRMRVLESRRAALIEDIKNFKEDPKRFFANMAEGDKTQYRVLTLFASLGGKGDELINTLVNRDLNLQRQELGRKENLLGRLVQEGNSLENAYKLAAATQKEIYATKLEQLLETTKNPLLASQARGTIAKLRADSVKNYVDVAKKSTELEFLPEELQQKVAHQATRDMIDLANLAYKNREQARKAARDPYARARLELAYEREDRMRRKEERDALAAVGSSEQQRFLNGEAMTGAQLRGKIDDKVFNDYAVPVRDPKTGAPTGYYVAAGDPTSKTKLKDFDVAANDYLGSLKGLRALLKPSVSSVTGLAGYSETASPKEYTAAKIYQRDLITKLGKLSELGVLQKSDVDFLMTIVPNLTEYERASIKESAFDTFEEMLQRAIANRRASYLASSDSLPPSGAVAPRGGFTPVAPRSIPPLTRPPELGGAKPPATPATPPSGVKGAGVPRKPTRR